MTTFEKLSLKNLLSHVPEILNLNFFNLKNLIGKFYLDESDSIKSHEMNVEGILEIGDTLIANNMIIKQDGSTISLQDILDRISKLETNEVPNESGDDSGKDE